jgi:hypothetical protein
LRITCPLCHPPVTLGDDGEWLDPPVTPGDDGEWLDPPVTPGDDDGGWIPDQVRDRLRLENTTPVIPAKAGIQFVISLPQEEEE